MRINAAGNVGIGTNDPEVKLDMEGGTLTRAVDISAGGAKGIFFRPSYTTALNN